MKGTNPPNVKSDESFLKKQNAIQPAVSPTTATTTGDAHEQNNQIKLKDRRIAGLFDIFMMSKLVNMPDIHKIMI
jgi:hypothetical protein